MKSALFIFALLAICALAGCEWPTGTNDDLPPKWKLVCITDSCMNLHDSTVKR